MIDQDVKPTIEAMDQELANVQAKVVPQYKQLNEEIILTTMSLDDQAQLSLASAYSVVTSYYCYRRNLDLPIDDVLKAKVDRITDYIRKVKNSDLTSMEEKRRKEKELRRKRDEIREQKNPLAKKKNSADDDEEDGMELALGVKRPRVNIEAANRIAEGAKFEQPQ